MPAAMSSNDSSDWPSNGAGSPPAMTSTPSPTEPASSSAPSSPGYANRRHALDEPQCRDTGRVILIQRRDGDSPCLALVLDRQGSLDVPGYPEPDEAVVEGLTSLVDKYFAVSADQHDLNFGVAEFAQARGQAVKVAIVRLLLVRGDGDIDLVIGHRQRCLTLLTIGED